MVWVPHTDNNINLKRPMREPHKANAMTAGVVRSFIVAWERDKTVGVMLLSRGCSWLITVCVEPVLLCGGSCGGTSLLNCQCARMFGSLLRGSS